MRSSPAGRYGVYAKSGRVSCSKFAAREALVDRLALQPAAARIRIFGARPIRTSLRRTFAIRDHIRRVVGDDVEIHLHAARVRAAHERLHLRFVAEMRIDAGEVRDPVAVIAGGFLAGPALHRLVLEHRREPDGGRAERLDVVEPRGEPLQIAAVKEPLRRGIEAVLQPVALQPTAIVRGIAVLEAVRQHEIDDLFRLRSLADCICCVGSACQRQEQQRIANDRRIRSTLPFDAMRSVFPSS